MADAVPADTAVKEQEHEAQRLQLQEPSPDDENRLADLIAQATSKYAVKDYTAAAELYSQATELQASIQGEMAVENADLLFSYGRVLFHVAVSKSDVLGAKAAGEKVGVAPSAASVPSEAPKTDNAANPPDGDSSEKRVAEEIVAHLATEKQKQEESETKPKATTSKGEIGDKPYFQFTGDENWDDSDEEDTADGEQEGEAPEEEEDDFATAFEVLDLARVLLVKRLNILQQDLASSQEKGKAKGDGVQNDPTSNIGFVKGRLADVHDFQAEISFEGEKWPNAASDLKASLALKQDLYPQDSNILAECHYKLSLALEFASVSPHRDEKGEIDENIPPTVDEKTREEAATHMEAAIDSCILRVSKETSNLVALGASLSEAETAEKKAEIDDVKEMVKDMQQRLEDLKKPPVSINDPLSTGDPHGATPLSGILGQILGESQEEQKKRLAEASAGATDISGLVKKKAAKRTSDVEATTVNGHGKRKADEIEDATSAKKAKVDDVGEE
ncbi:MAG: hypothetical protein Q9160_008688 [Pyrenula sp. 1 TL-2023]